MVENAVTSDDGGSRSGCGHGWRKCSWAKETDMETCHEYLGCDKYDCVMHGRRDNDYCWEVEDTLCNHHGIEIVRGKLGAGKKVDACILSGCIYYTFAKARSQVRPHLDHGP
jgi:hypothetical protein